MAASNCTAPGGGDSTVTRELRERREFPESSSCYWVVTGLLLVEVVMDLSVHLPGG